jgi:hypothetical protein
MNVHSQIANVKTWKASLILELTENDSACRFSCPSPKYKKTGFRALHFRIDVAYTRGEKPKLFTTRLDPFLMIKRNRHADNSLPIKSPLFRRLAKAFPATAFCGFVTLHSANANCGIDAKL